MRRLQGAAPSLSPFAALASGLAHPCSDAAASASSSPHDHSRTWPSEEPATRYLPCQGACEGLPAWPSMTPAGRQRSYDTAARQQGAHRRDMAAARKGMCSCAAAAVKMRKHAHVCPAHSLTVPSMLALAKNTVVEPSSPLLACCTAGPRPQLCDRQRHQQQGGPRGASAPRPDCRRWWPPTPSAPCQTHQPTP